MGRKIALGEWFESGYKTLARMKHLRGTRLDPFGYAHIRKLERELIDEYQRLIDELISKLNPDNHAVAVEIARLPDLIRGYEEVKLAGVAEYRRRLAELRPRLDAPAVPVKMAITHP
jgi:indolepyruvate ferredoxin oxidoreductase